MYYSQVVNGLTVCSSVSGSLLIYNDLCELYEHGIRGYTSVKFFHSDIKYVFHHSEKKSPT